MTFFFDHYISLFKSMVKVIIKGLTPILNWGPDGGVILHS